MDTSRAHCTYRTNICWAITPRRPLFSHIIAIPPARAPARAACHLLVFFLTMASCALVLSDKRAVRFERGTRRVVLGCSAVGPASRSSSKKGEVLSSFCEGFLDGGGLSAGIRIGRAFNKNLYIEVKVPSKEITLIRCSHAGQKMTILTQHRRESPSISPKDSMPHNRKPYVPKQDKTGYKTEM